MTSDEFQQLLIFKCIDAPSWVRYVGVDSDGCIFGCSHDIECEDSSSVWSVDVVPVRDTNEQLWNDIGHITLPNGINWRETKIKLY